MMSEYIPGEFLKKSVESKDEYAVRGAIVAIILSDPSFSKGEADKAIAYAINNGISVYEKHDDTYSMETDKTKWSKDIFADETTFLQRNFSKERFANIKLIGQNVYKPTNSSKKGTCSSTTTQATGNRATLNKEKQDFLTGRRLLLAAAIGVVAATVIIVAMKK